MIIRNDLLDEWDFTEGFPATMKKQVYTDHGFRVVNPGRSGGQSWGRFELRTDNLEKVYRSEFATTDAPENHVKYGWSVFFPIEYWASAACYDIVMQLHGHDDVKEGEKARNPHFCLFVYKNRLKCTIRYSSLRVNTNDNDIEKTFDLGPLIKDKEIFFILDFKYSYKEDGFAILLMNNKKVIDYKGGTTFNDAKRSYFKGGCYCRSAKKTRVVFYRNLRRGKGIASLLSVAP